MYNGTLQQAQLQLQVFYIINCNHRTEQTAALSLACTAVDDCLGMLMQIFGIRMESHKTYQLLRQLPDANQLVKTAHNASECSHISCMLDILKTLHKLHKDPARRIIYNVQFKTAPAAACG